MHCSRWQIRIGNQAEKGRVAVMQRHHQGWQQRCGRHLPHSLKASPRAILPQGDTGREIIYKLYSHNPQPMLFESNESSLLANAGFNGQRVLCQDGRIIRCNGICIIQAIRRQCERVRVLRDGIITV